MLQCYNDTYKQETIFDIDVSEKTSHSSLQ